MELKFIENLDEVLVIDIDKIGIPNSPELSEWFLINSIRLRVGSLPKPLCTRNHQLINLSDLQTAAEQSIWLQKNSKFICFSKSYPNIEKVHKIENNPAQIKIINDKITKNDKVSLSVSELLAIMYNYNLDSYNYEKYLVFEIIDKKLNPT